MEQLCRFLDTSPSMYHAVENLREAFTAAGYAQLSEKEDWILVPGGKYCLTRGGSAFVAFQIPADPAGFAVAACHSDRPCLKVKENSALSGTYTRLSVETYGGLIMSTWLDRPLSIAGRVFVETENGIESRLVNIDRDVALIPNVAIHMNREVNTGYKWNPATDLLPLIGGKDAGEKLDALLEEAAGGKILSHDLYLYVRENARVWGLDNEFLSAPALDDLACVWAAAEGLKNAENPKSVPVLCVFDSEEVGSCSPQGADGTLLTDVLARICKALGLNKRKMYAGSFLLSADNAHAIHPNHPEFADQTNAPVLNGGIVLKFNADLRYTTDGCSAAVVRHFCREAGITAQNYYNRADIKGGSTLGHISAGHLSVSAADIGLGQLAMHSCYETAGVRDAADMVALMKTYFTGYSPEIVRN